MRHTGGHSRLRRNVVAGITEQVGVSGVELLLKPLDLFLEESDGADAAVDGVSDASLGLVGEGIDGVFSLVRRELVEELRDVTGTEYFVDVGEFLRLFGWEVRSENTTWQAFSPEELAGSTWRIVRARRRRRHLSLSLEKLKFALWLGSLPRKIILL